MKNRLPQEKAAAGGFLLSARQGRFQRAYGMAYRMERVYPKIEENAIAFQRGCRKEKQRLDGRRKRAENFQKAIDKSCRARYDI